MGEDRENKNYKNYPIKMVAVRLGWILGESGKEMLQAMLISENLELFNINTTIVIIEFLYKHYRDKILKTQLPLYMLQLLFYFIFILVTPGTTKIIVAGINLFFSLISLIVILINSKFVGPTYFKSPWAYFDIIYVALNSNICIAELSGDVYMAHDTMRSVSAVLAIIIFAKLLYFMQLID